MPSDYISSVDSFPCPKVYNASMMETVNLQTNASPRNFLVIFDSGATLVISSSKEDFVGPIVPFRTKRTLGGMTGNDFIYLKLFTNVIVYFIAAHLFIIYPNT